MTTKPSKKTEDMLDQTFANFDNEVTGAQTEEVAPATGGGSSAVKKSKNMPLIIGCGIAAVGFIGYIVVKPMFIDAPVPAQTAQVKPLNPVAPVAAVQPVAQPAVVNPVAPIDPLQAKMPIASASEPAASVSVDPIKDSAALAEKASVDPLKVQAPVVSVVNPVAPVVSAEPIKNPVASVKVQSAPAANQQVAVADELKKMFEQQTTEFQTLLNDTTGRLTVIESTLAAQKDINQKVDERLVALETGKAKAHSKAKQVAPVTPVTPVSQDGNLNTDTNLVVAQTPVKKAKKKVSKKVITKDLSIVTEQKDDSSVLVNKVDPKTSKDLKAEKMAKDAIEVAALGKVEFHSIYGGRVWVKNEDGSLSTYSAGDRLATGEIIKSISDENFEVVTNRRILKN